MHTGINSTADLQRRIAELEEAERMQKTEIRYTATQLAKSVTPGNLVKSFVSNIKTSPHLRNSLLDTAVGIGAGFVGKKLFVGKSRNILKRLGGTAIEFIVANMIRKRIPALRERVKAVNGVNSVSGE